ncbi:hypothetical protein WH47_08504 [Habropoda laboriosa]|uniref:Uncharacterized protein n=1 Tax=Habropoda laboriosa TaxID=597456 RepID=A0A0L7QPH4_9HYME|nr:hypothetical protein WH47_08504 [Habropoda laboriosa]
MKIYHILYSPDLSSYDYRLVPSVSNFLANNPFENVVEIKTAVNPRKANGFRRTREMNGK